jgi:hypothetical protein
MGHRMNSLFVAAKRRPSESRAMIVDCIGPPTHEAMFALTVTGATNSCAVSTFDGVAVVRVVWPLKNGYSTTQTKFRCRDDFHTKSSRYLMYALAIVQKRMK